MDMDETQDNTQRDQAPPAAVLGDDPAADQSEKTVIPVSKTFFVGYAVVVGLLYHFGFWGTLGINILQYTALLDIAKLAIWPIFLTVLYVFGAMAAPRKTPHLGAIAWAAVAVSIVVAIIYFFLRDPYAWTALSVACGAAAGLWATSRFELDIAPQRIRSYAMFPLVLTPFIAWGIGVADLGEIERGDDYMRATLPAETLKASGVQEGAELRLLGNTGSYTLFLIGAGPRVLVVANSHLDYLSLTEIWRNGPAIAPKAPTAPPNQPPAR
jgi:hypothetical protein